MQAVTSFIDTIRNVNDFENNTKVILLIQQQLVQSKSDGDKPTTLKANVPIFTIMASSKVDMLCLYDTYHEYMAKRKEKTRKFKVAPFIADPKNSRGKRTKVLPKVC